MKKPSFRLRAGAALCAAIAAVSVQAQQPQQPQAQAEQPQQQRASRSMIDEVVVTAQRREASLQDTAVAVSAFDQAGLERERLNTVQDMQLSVPNLTFSQANFTGNNIQIRGIGNNAVATSSDSGTAINFNGAYLQQSSVMESELFDVERVEVLRGPQGTLYGRNTTGGVVNIIPAKADPTQQEASIDFEVGNFQSRKATGMFNLPLGDNAAIRVSGRWIERDGYVDNVYADERPDLGLDSDIDNRDLWATRVALNFTPTDRTEVNFFWQRFREDSTRMRTSNQTCAKDDTNFPLSMGCLPNQPIDSAGVLNSQSQLGGILGNLSPFLNIATSGQVDVFGDSQRPSDLREVRTMFNPIYEMDEDLFNLELVHDFDQYTVTAALTYQELEFFSQTDYQWAVPEFSNPAAGGASTFTPNVSDPATGSFTDANGVLTVPSDSTVSGYDRPFSYDQSAFQNEAWTFESRVQSSWVDSPFDFLAGFFYLKSENDTIYDVRSNTLAAFTPVGGVAADGSIIADGADIQLLGGGAAPLSFYRSDNMDYELETWAVFGEFYTDISDRTRLTLGLRYSDETKDIKDRQTLLNDPGQDYVEGISNRAFLHDTFNPAVLGFLVPATEADLSDRRFQGYGTGASPVGGPANNALPPLREFGESWNELTGKVTLDHYMDLGFTDETMTFITLSRSYKSGGINPPSFTGAFEETFAPEYINSIELGAKNTLMDGRMQANITYFYYDYDGLQNTKIVDRTSVNENIDAEIQGLELEFIYSPIENLRIDAFASWLDTSIKGGTSINPADPTAGNPNWVGISNTAADMYIAPRPGTTFEPGMCGQNNLECATVFQFNPHPDAQDPANPFAGQGIETPTVQVPIGFAEDLSGNSLPGTPEWEVKIGAQYSIFLDNGVEIVPRVDFYWQDEMYYRIYNSEQDKIPSWTQWNASLSAFGDGGNWYATAWVKNIGNKDHITGAYFTDASSGNFTNVFLLEPRTYGLSVGMRF